MNGILIVRFKEGVARVFGHREWTAYGIDQNNETVKVTLPDGSIEHFLLLNLHTIEIDY